jgi:hypothetical protein
VAILSFLGNWGVFVLLSIVTPLPFSLQVILSGSLMTSLNILRIRGSLQSGEENSEKCTISIIAETPRLVVYSLPMLVTSLSFTFGQKYKIT